MTTCRRLSSFGPVRAPSKRKLKNRKHYPPARMVTDYYGAAMFNREPLWVDFGCRPTPDYRSPAWVRTTRFFRHAISP
jgi:hypothetical protein